MWGIRRELYALDKLSDVLGYVLYFSYVAHIIVNQTIYIFKQCNLYQKKTKKKLEYDEV